MKAESIKRMIRSQKGYSLTEIVIALLIFGIVGASVMSGLDASSKTITNSQEITVAESLTRTTIEYIKRSPYDSSYDTTQTPPLYPKYDTRSQQTGAVNYVTLLNLNGDPYYNDYTIGVTAERLDPKGDGTGNDDGIQKITVEIRYHGRLKLTTVDYKVSR